MGFCLHFRFRLIIWALFHTCWRLCKRLKAKNYGTNFVEISNMCKNISYRANKIVVCPLLHTGFFLHFLIKLGCFETNCYLEFYFCGLPSQIFGDYFKKMNLYISSLNEKDFSLHNLDHVHNFFIDICWGITFNFQPLYLTNILKGRPRQNTSSSRTL